MVNFIRTIRTAAAVLFAAANAAALPHDVGRSPIPAADAHSAPPIIEVRGATSSPNPHVRVRDALYKRALSTVAMTCYVYTGCTGPSYSWDTSFDSNLCVQAPNCQCFIVTTLDNAHISWWNKAGCNGNRSWFDNGCDISLPTTENSPGTNSIGFQVGCT
ncbi:hypothetical protein G7Y89_g5543 [Cudoniella acicularis]|uniref:Uncharacterized protein n=1 Tax=Cudoniella acicularis TaxID=354080 RepID=A0A8H4W3W5_9HELO|nr:hypothetical protein G7Y89_g5543 [Cudoniella acicularis]